MKALLLVVVATFPLAAETGAEAWLRYRPLAVKLPTSIVSLGAGPEVVSAANELSRAIEGFTGSKVPTLKDAKDGSAILGTFSEIARAYPGIAPPAIAEKDGYCLKAVQWKGRQVLLVASPGERGVLYAVFSLIRQAAQGTAWTELDRTSEPAAPIRWVNEWDNLNGTIERGFAGRSFFFDNNDVVADLTRAGAYARLLASIGINGCTVNNVNANPIVLSSDFLPKIARIADVFRPWGVRLSLSVDFASPKTVGGLDTFDPHDARVVEWWAAKATEIYGLIPDFAGFVLKADSEGQVGPSTYGRSHAEAANLLAKALRPHGGIVIYRGFVYNHHADWRNLKNDRARAAYDNFAPLNGQFADNALVQVKHGPIDFQAREPVSPLIGALTKTSQTLELQITQEYTGQQHHLCFLAPMWKQVLDFDLRVDGQHTRVSDISAGKTFHRRWGGFVGVSDVGLDANWLGFDLALANLYAFGRLAWDPGLSADGIAQEWTRQTFGNDQRVVGTIDSLLMDSWRVYEGYTGPLGLGTLTDILHGHFGPNIQSAERNGWGQWLRADHEGIGMDRTVATGTGYIGQYPPDVARMYESLKECPDELVLFMHRLPYTYVLHSGKTIIQHVYDSHYAAAEEARQFPVRWRELKGLVDDERYNAVLARLTYQAGHAIVWRDAICSWFLKESGIADAQGRAGHFPDRMEAEAMKLVGYAAEDVQPWEDASGGKAVVCLTSPCSASFVFIGAAGQYRIAVQYFDLNSGVARFQLRVGGRSIDSWSADANLPADRLGGDSSTRRTVEGIALKPGDVIAIEGVSDRGDEAAVDYIEVTAER